MCPERLRETSGWMRWVDLVRKPLWWGLWCVVHAGCHAVSALWSRRCIYSADVEREQHEGSTCSENPDSVGVDFAFLETKTHVARKGFCRIVLLRFRFFSACFRSAIQRTASPACDVLNARSQSRREPRHESQDARHRTRRSSFQRQTRHNKRQKVPNYRF
jgi:hypothetical protein